MKIPPWYFEEFGVPHFILRMKICRLTSRQKVLAYLARMYYIYRFDVAPVYETVPLTTSSRVKASQCDGMSALLWSAFRTKYWFSPASRLFGRLKVLLRPVKGW